jgi:hypothetical protein
VKFIGTGHMGYTSGFLAGRGTPDPSIPGGLAVDTNLGWKGAERYVATVPQIFDLWQNPQERYDFFMNNFKASSTAPVMVEEVKKLMQTYVRYPPRKLQSLGDTGPITIVNYQRFRWIRDQLAKEAVNLPPSTGN